MVLKACSKTMETSRFKMERASTGNTNYVQDVMGRCFRFLNLMLLSCVLSLRHFCEDGTQIFSCPSESTVICGHNAPACMALSCVVSLHIANRATNRQRFARNMLTCPNVQSNPSSPGRILQVMMIFCFGVETQTNITSAFRTVLSHTATHIRTATTATLTHVGVLPHRVRLGTHVSQVRYGCGEVKSLRLGMPFIHVLHLLHCGLPAKCL